MLTDLRSEPNALGVKGNVPDRISTGFAAAYRAEAPYVLRLLKRLGVRDGNLEDVAHDVFLAAYRRFDEYDATRPVRPWLFGFAYRVAADHRRLFRHKYESYEEVETPDLARLPDEELAVRQARQLILRVFDELDFERRAILIMHDLEEQAVPEIARAFGIPLNTAYSRLRLARRDFESALRRIDEHPVAGGRT